MRTIKRGRKKRERQRRRVKQEKRPNSEKTKTKREISYAKYDEKKANREWIKEKNQSRGK